MDKQAYSKPKCCSFNIAIHKIACGLDHSVFITTNGLVYSMGSNNRGQLGINDPEIRQRSSPILIEMFINKQPFDAECGDSHSIVLCNQDQGTAYSWGSNEFGQTGGGACIGSCDIVYSPRLVNFEQYSNPNILKLSCGTGHSAFVDDKGHLYQCGENNHGQLGIGTFINEPKPVHVSSFTDKVMQIECGTQVSTVLTDQGKILVMGSNQNGQLGIGQEYQDQSTPVFLDQLDFTSITDISSGSFSSALSIDKQFFMWGRGVFGDFYTPHRVKVLNKLDIKDFKVSNGGATYILTQQGQVYSWGDNSYGQLGTGDFQMRERPLKIKALENRQISQISLGTHFAIALGQTYTRTIEHHSASCKSVKQELGGPSSVILRQDSSLISIDQIQKNGAHAISKNSLGSKRGSQRSGQDPKNSKKQSSLSKKRKRAANAGQQERPAIGSYYSHISQNSQNHKLSSSRTQLNQVVQQVREKSYENLNDGLKMLAKASAGNKHQKTKINAQNRYTEVSHRESNADIKHQFNQFDSLNQQDLLSGAIGRRKRISNEDIEINMQVEMVGGRNVNGLCYLPATLPGNDEPSQKDNRNERSIMKEVKSLNVAQSPPQIQDTGASTRYNPSLDHKQQNKDEYDDELKHQTSFRPALHGVNQASHESLDDHRYQKPDDQRYHQTHEPQHKKNEEDEINERQIRQKRTQLDQIAKSHQQHLEYQSQSLRIKHKQPSSIERGEGRYAEVPRDMREQRQLDPVVEQSYRKCRDPGGQSNEPKKVLVLGGDNRGGYISIEENDRWKEQNYKPRQNSNYKASYQEMDQLKAGSQYKNAKFQSKSIEATRSDQANGGNHIDVQKSHRLQDRWTSSEILSGTRQTATKVRNRLDQMREKSNRTPAEQHQSLVNQLLGEKDQLIEDLQHERDTRLMLQKDLEKIKTERLEEMKGNHQQLIELQSCNRQLEYDVKRYKNMVIELEERCEQHRVVKENLRRKVRETEQAFHEMADKKNNASKEAQQAAAEAVQFRDDVEFLTKETSTLLDELKEQQQQNLKLEKELQKVESELQSQLDLNNAQIQKDIEQIDLLSGQNDKLRADNDDLRQKVEDISNEKKNVLRDLQLQGDQMREMQSEIPRRIECEKQMKILKEQNQIQTNDIHNLRESIENLIQSKSQLADELERALHNGKHHEAQYQVLEGEMASLKAQNFDLKTHLNEVNELNVRLQQKIDGEIIKRANLFAEQTRTMLDRTEKGGAGGTKDYDHKSNHTNNGGYHVRLENQRLNNSRHRSRPSTGQHSMHKDDQSHTYSRIQSPTGRCEMANPIRTQTNQSNSSQLYRSYQANPLGIHPVERLNDSSCVVQQSSVSPRKVNKSIESIPQASYKHREPENDGRRGISDVSVDVGDGLLGRRPATSQEHQKNQYTRDSRNFYSPYNVEVGQAPQVAAARFKRAGFTEEAHTKYLNEIKQNDRIEREVRIKESENRIKEMLGIIDDADLKVEPKVEKVPPKRSTTLESRYGKQVADTRELELTISSIPRAPSLGRGIGQEGLDRGRSIADYRDELYKRAVVYPSLREGELRSLTHSPQRSTKKSMQRPEIENVQKPTVSPSPRGSQSPLRSKRSKSQSILNQYLPHYLPQIEDKSATQQMLSKEVSMKQIEPDTKIQSTSKAIALDALLKAKYSERQLAKMQSQQSLDGGDDKENDQQRSVASGLGSLPPHRSVSQNNESHDAPAAPMNPFSSHHQLASKVVKESLADLKVRLAQMREERKESNDVKGDLEKYEERRRSFENRLAQ